MPQSTLEAHFISTSLQWMRYYKSLGDQSIARLSAEQLHVAPNASSNSIAVIVRHLHGNMLSRWTDFMNTDGEKEWRQRDEEFESHHETKQQLLERWEAGWTCCFQALGAIREEDLMKTIYIRQQPLSVLDAVQRQLAHYPYHVGQIVYLSRMMLDQQWESLSIPKKVK